jgi:hypothetical protein
VGFYNGCRCCAKKVGETVEYGGRGGQCFENLSATKELFPDELRLRFDDN